MNDIFNKIEQKRKKIIKNKFSLEYFTNKFNPISNLRERFNTKGEYDYCIGDLQRIIDSYSFATASAITFYELLPPIKLPHIFEGANEKLFFYFMDDSFIRLYGIWNRVGNFINLFFKKNSQGEKIYFEKMIDLLNHAPYNQLKEFVWLYAFRDSKNGYKKILKFRHPIIHSEISYSSFFRKLIETASNASNQSKIIKELETEREQNLNFFLGSFNQIDAGLSHMVNFIKKSFLLRKQNIPLLYLDSQQEKLKRCP